MHLFHSDACNAALSEKKKSHFNQRNLKFPPHYNQRYPRSVFCWFVLWPAVLPFMTLSRAAQTREGHFPCVCVFMCVCVCTCPACQRAHHSLWCPQRCNTLTDLWSSAFALCQGYKTVTKPIEHSQDPTGPHPETTELLVVLAFSVWYRHTSYNMC